MSFAKATLENGYSYEIGGGSTGGFWIVVASRFGQERFEGLSATDVRAKVLEAKAREPIGYCLRLMKIEELLGEIEEEICTRPDVYELLEKVRDARASAETAAYRAEALDREIAAQSGLSEGGDQ